MSHLILLLSLLIPTTIIHAQTCLSSATSDTVKTSPTISLPSSPVGVKIYGNCSEKVKIYTQGGFLASPWQREGCPHLIPGLALATPITAGADITITIPTLLKACHLPTNNGVINRITIPNGATLIIDDQDMTLHVREINVAQGGSLLIGSPTCRLYSKIVINFYGTKTDSSQSAADTTKTSKGLISSGIVDMHGKQYHPTWTRLSRTATAGTNLLYLQDTVNWEVGQTILITTTIHFDCPTEWAQDYCRPCHPWECNDSIVAIQHQNEVRTITGIVMDTDQRGHVIQINTPLSNQHYGGAEYQAEVALLSRRIQIKGVQTNDNYGHHMRIQGAQAQGRFSGVQSDNGGQLNILGRYPFHHHMMYEQNVGINYVQDCSVTNSNFRAYVIHGTNQTRLSRNVAYNIKGMAFYLEDGVEERNTIEYNLAAHVHPIFKPAAGYGQGGEAFVSSADLIIPADTSASGFYIPNAYNSFIGNAASGGWSGFAFPNTPAPLGDFKGTIPRLNEKGEAYDDPYNPQRRPLLKFLGNTAHSTGFYWKDHGSAVYVGAMHFYDPKKGDALSYSSGRHSRDTVDGFKGNSQIMVFENTKVFLSIKGISHWGNTVNLLNSEMHDIRVSAMLFGNAALTDALVNARTSNHPAGVQGYFLKGKEGFQMYDTYVRTILNRVTFRNFDVSSGDYAVRYMDHSDQFLPQGINAARGLVFQNMDANAVLGIQNCGDECGTGTYNTMSSKIYTVWDWDGSLVRTQRRSIVGSNRAWWNWAPECSFRPDLRVWTCPWYPKTTVGYFGIVVPSLMNGCDTAKSSTCDSQKAGYTVGRVSHWSSASATNFIDISPWPGVTGLTNTGWLWRPKATVYGVDGAPSQFQIDNFQLPRENFVVLAVRYPAAATFKVRMLTNWWNSFLPDTTYPYIPMATSLAIVLTKSETLKPADSITCAGSGAEWYRFCTIAETGGVGPAWFFDGSHLYLRIVNPMCYNENTKTSCASLFTSDGISIGDITNAFKYDIQVACPGCAVQSTLGAVTYWSVPDTAPSAAFAPDWGALPSGLASPVPIATVTPFQCAVPSGTITSAPTQATTTAPATVAPATATPTTKTPTTTSPATASPTTKAPTTTPATDKPTTKAPTTPSGTSSPTQSTGSTTKPPTGAATTSPTSSSTSGPTSSPTSLATSNPNNPTAGPNGPTVFPTDGPTTVTGTTDAPTPTSSPTDGNPNPNPTGAPTQAPTSPPTGTITIGNTAAANAHIHIVSYVAIIVSAMFVARAI